MPDHLQRRQAFGGFDAPAAWTADRYS